MRSYRDNGKKVLISFLLFLIKAPSLRQNPIRWPHMRGGFRAESVSTKYDRKRQIESAPAGTGGLNRAPEHIEAADTRFTEE
jgi:hypothetical protein